jgi:ABC-type transport system substrate-binding protein
MLIVALGMCFSPRNAQAEIKELVIGIGIDADTLLPYDQTTTLMQNMADLLYDSFLYQDPEGKLHPRLATAYDVSPDGLTYTIHLRKGVKFSDGSDFNADAAKAGWDNVLNPKTRVPLRFAVGMVKECVKIDDYTIQLKLKFAFAPLAPTMSMSLISPISPAALKKYGEDIRQHPTGAGPYILHKWVKGDRIEMVRNEGVTTNKKVRHAFNYAVDKKAIVKKILFDTAEPMDGPVSPKVFGHFKMAHQYDYNPEKAKQLLKEANFDFSKTVSMRTPQGRYLFDRQVSEAIQAYLQAIGVKAELRTYDWPTYVAGLLKPLAESELEVFLLGWGPLILDADMGLYGQFTCEVNPPKGLGAAFYCNPEYDRIMKASRQEQDPQKRLALLKQASEIVWDDAPWMWLHVEKFVIAYSSKIKGMVVTPTEKFYPHYITMQ